MEKLRQEATQEHVNVCARPPACAPVCLTARCTHFQPRVVKDEAHAIKGAAANLMVYRIRWTAAAMEQPAKDVMTGER